VKFKTFVRLRAAVIALAALGAVVGIFFGCRPSRVASPEPQVAPAVNAATRLNSVTADPQGRNYGLTDVQREILKLQKEPLTNGSSDGNSRKWVVKTSRYKAEFRCDEDKGSQVWNRVKIDFNNNKKYDERWDFKPDTVKRRVARNDDENYTAEYRLQGETWVRK
jgi:hypothetical protein